MSQPTTHRSLTISPRTFTTWLGAALAVVGLLLLLVLPVSASVDGVSVGCGTGLSASRGAANKDATADYSAAFDGLPGHSTTFEDACAAARSARAPWGWVLVGAGGVVLAGARLVRWSGQPA